MARSGRGRRTSPLYLPSAFDLFVPSKNLVIANIWIFGPLYAMTFIFWIHSWIWTPLPNAVHHWYNSADGLSVGWAGSPLPAYFTFLAVGFSLLWLVIIVAFGSIAQMMSHAAQLDAAEKRHLSFDSLLKVVKQLGWRLIGLYIVLLILVTIGLFLLVIPGLILATRYFLAPYVMIDRNCSLSEAMAQSAKLSRLNSGSIWGIFGVMFLIGLANIVPIIGGLASFILGCLYSLAPALRYTQLKKLA